MRAAQHRRKPLRERLANKRRKGASRKKNKKMKGGEGGRVAVLRPAWDPKTPQGRVSERKKELDTERIFGPFLRRLLGSSKKERTTYPSGIF